MKNHQDNELKMTHKLTFKPHPLVRNHHIQTILSSVFRYNDGRQLEEASQTMILEVGEGVRLEGIYTPQTSAQSKGLVFFLHGWLGCVHSHYAVEVGDYLFQQGYSIFRLNFRDHGYTEALNREVFRADRLDEVFEAARQVAQFEADRPFHVVGVSMGGNFALRLAWRHSQTPLPNLQQTIAICPVIDAYRATLAIDQQPLYLPYFRRRWRAMLEQKKQFFPEINDLSTAMSAPNCLAMSEAFVAQHSPYPDARTYFESYSIKPEMLAALRSPVQIIAAADDPIIPSSDFPPLEGLSPYLHLSLQPHGGHVGFVDLFPFRLWLSEAIKAILEDQAGSV
jgi:hypothetical protein